MSKARKKRSKEIKLRSAYQKETKLRAHRTRKIETIMRLLQQSNDKKWSIDQLALACNCSPRTVYAQLTYLNNIGTDVIRGGTKGARWIALESRHCNASR